MTSNENKVILRLPQVLARIGVHTSTLNRWEAAGHFPKRIHLGKNSVGWLEEELNDWLEIQAQERQS